MFYFVHIFMRTVSISILRLDEWDYKTCWSIGSIGESYGCDLMDQIHSGFWECTWQRIARDCAKTSMFSMMDVSEISYVYMIPFQRDSSSSNANVHPVKLSVSSPMLLPFAETDAEMQARTELSCWEPQRWQSAAL